MEVPVSPEFSVRHEPDAEGEGLFGEWAILHNGDHLWRCDTQEEATRTVTKIRELMKAGEDFHDWLLNEWWIWIETVS